MSHPMQPSPPADVAEEPGWSRRGWQPPRLRTTWPFLTVQQIELFKEVFQILDSDEKGFFTEDELVEVMRAMGGNPTPQEVEAVMFELDANSDRAIDFGEFMAKFWDCLSDREIVGVFNQLGILHEPGKEGPPPVAEEKPITMTALERCFAYVGEPLNDTDKKYLEAMFKGADSQGEGRLRFSDLMAYLDRVEEEVGAPSKEEEAVLALAAAAEQQQHGITGRKGRRGSVLLPSDDTKITKPLNLLTKLAPKALVRSNNNNGSGGDYSGGHATHSHTQQHLHHHQHQVHHHSSGRGPQDSGQHALVSAGDAAGTSSGLHGVASPASASMQRHLHSLVHDLDMQQQQQGPPRSSASGQQHRAGSGAMGSMRSIAHGLSGFLRLGTRERLGPTGGAAAGGGGPNSSQDGTTYFHNTSMPRQPSSTAHSSSNFVQQAQHPGFQEVAHTRHSGAVAAGAGGRRSFTPAESSGHSFSRMSGQCTSQDVGPRVDRVHSGTPPSPLSYQHQHSRQQRQQHPPHLPQPQQQTQQQAHAEIMPDDEPAAASMQQPHQHQHQGTHIVLYPPAPIPQQPAPPPNASRQETQQQAASSSSSKPRGPVSEATLVGLGHTGVNYRGKQWQHPNDAPGRLHVARHHQEGRPAAAAQTAATWSSWLWWPWQGWGRRPCPAGSSSGEEGAASAQHPIEVSNSPAAVHGAGLQGRHGSELMPRTLSSVPDSLSSHQATADVEEGGWAVAVNTPSRTPAYTPEHAGGSHRHDSSFSHAGKR